MTPITTKNLKKLVKVSLKCILRHAALNALLVTDGLGMNDMPGNGNCLFSAASHAAFGHGDQQLSLHALTVDNIAKQEPVYCKLFNPNSSDFIDLLSDLKTPGTVLVNLQYTRSQMFFTL